MRERWRQAWFLIKVFFMVIAILQCGWLPNPYFIPEVKASPATTVFTSTASDGSLRENGANYNTVWTETSASFNYNTSSAEYVGQGYIAFQYYIWRGYLYFDTSSLPDDSTITEVILSLNITTDSSTTDFNITIQNGQPTYPHGPLELGDYAKGNYSGNGGYLDTSDISTTNVYYNITVTQLSWINKTGTTKLCLRSSRDIDGTSPSGNERVRFEYNEGVAPPKLYVTYETPTNDLWVWKFDGTEDSWIEVGASPYLNNDTSNYVYTTSGAQNESWFLFQNTSLPNLNNVSNVYLEIEHKYGGSQKSYQIIMHNGTDEIDFGTYTPSSTSYTWLYINCTEVLDSIGEINASKMKLINIDGGLLNIQIRKARLRLYYDNESPPTPYSGNPPELKYVNLDSVIAETSATFATKWQSEYVFTHLDGYIFSWNASGSWQNDTWVSWSGNPDIAWANVSKTLPSENTTVAWKFYVNDTIGQWTTQEYQMYTLKEMPTLDEKFVGYNFFGGQAILYEGNKTALYYAYHNTTTGWYCIIAFDYSVKEWVGEFNVTDSNGWGDTHYQPSLGVFPDGRLGVFWARGTKIQYKSTVYSADTEENLTKLLTNWSSETTINQTDDTSSYPKAISFDDKLMIFYRAGDPNNGNWTYIDFKAQTVERIQNGNFSSDASDWTFKDPGAQRSTGDWENTGRTGGSVYINTEQNNKANEAYWYQIFTLSQTEVEESTEATLNFSYRVTDYVNIDSLELRVDLELPNGTVNTLWSHTVTGTAWTDISLDILGNLTNQGYYELRLVHNVDTGTNGNATNYWDDISLVIKPYGWAETQTRLVYNSAPNNYLFDSLYLKDSIYQYGNWTVFAGYTSTQENSSTPMIRDSLFFYSDDRCETFKVANGTALSVPFSTDDIKIYANGSVSYFTIDDQNRTWGFGARTDQNNASTTRFAYWNNTLGSSGSWVFVTPKDIYNLTIQNIAYDTIHFDYYYQQPSFYASPTQQENIPDGSKVFHYLVKYVKMPNQDVFQPLYTDTDYKVRVEGYITRGTGIDNGMEYYFDTVAGETRHDIIGYPYEPSTNYFSGNSSYFTKFTANDTEYIQGIQIYASTQSSAYLKAAIYNSTLDQLAYSTSACWIGARDGWTLTIALNEIVQVSQGETYWLGISSGTTGHKFYYSDGATNQTFSIWLNYSDANTFPESMNGWTNLTYYDRKLSVIGVITRLTIKRWSVVPIASNIGANNTVAGESTKFYAFWRDEVNIGLSIADFYWNASGTMQYNGSYTFSGNPVQGWSNFTRTLPTDSSLLIAWYIVANNSLGDQGNTTIHYLDITKNESVTLTFQSTESFTLSLDWDASLNVPYSSSQTWNLLRQVDFNVMPAWDFSQTWQILTDTDFNVLLTLSHSIEWLLEVIHTPAGGQVFTVDLTWSLSQTWTVIIAWIATVHMSFNTSQTWATIIGWDATVNLPFVVSQSWNLITDNTFNVILLFPNTITWTLEVIQGTVFVVDLSWSNSISWTLEVLRTVGEQTTRRKGGGILPRDLLPRDVFPYNILPVAVLEGLSFGQGIFLLLICVSAILFIKALGTKQRRRSFRQKITRKKRRKNVRRKSRR